MADVRFLRHLRDTNPKKTTLVRGRRVTREDALEEKLAAAKQGESDILAKLTSLRGHGKTTKKKQENNEKRFRWITEAKKLNQTEVHLWNDALDTLTSLCQRIDDEDGVVSCDDIRREATEAEADRISQQHTLVATVSQLKDSSRDNSTAAAGPVRQRGAAQLKHAVKRNRDQTFIQHKLGLIKNLRAQQGIELERLEAEEAEHTSLVDFAARFISNLEAEDRQRQQQEQDERILAMGAVSIPGSDKVFQALYESICEIDDTYVTQLRAIQLNEGPTLAAHTSLNSSHGGGGGEGGGEGEGIWTPRKHARFIKVVKSSAALAGEVSLVLTGRGGLLKQLQRELPEVPPGEMEKRLDVVHRRKFNAHRRAALQRESDLRRTKAVDAAALALHHLHLHHSARLALDAQAQEQEARCVEAKERLALLRHHKAEQDAHRIGREEEHAELEAQEERRRAAIMAEQRARMKEDIDAYRAKKRREEEVRQMLRVWEHWRQAKPRREAAASNAERVDVRIAQYQMKVERLKQRKAAAARAHADLQLRLEQLRAQVAPDVEADPDRLYTHTDATTAYKEGVMFGEKETGTRVFAVNHKNFYAGYTIDRLMGDTRHRLAVALHENGLAGTEAGREALMRIKGSLMPRKDMFTSDQLAQAGLS